ncbi:RDD family protein [Cellulosimicrobium protaetiae]|uniref:FHA domain-containing protein n=1 Tax=Cellulosimicrobium protaetiae TaxID=2587808 RepID=A0A6M5UJY6_9MICO|nr:RDD family protein [Cellulosimicrobium protaetiae]QJW37633.1 FHA domain-containing protein [Cellulosimicrobium protaetiae]
MSDVTCAACGSAQSAGSAFCAVCGQPFPRTGRPVAAPPTGPLGGVQAVAARAGSDLPYAAPAHTAPDTTTEPEVYAATQKAFGQPASPPSSSLASAPFAGRGRRFLAYVIDAAVPGLLALVVVVAGLAIVGAPLGDVQVVTQDEAAALIGKMLVVYVVAGVLALAWWVGVWFWEGSTGKTLGNLATGIRTVDAATRGPVGFGRAALRWIIVGVVPAGGILVVLLSPGFDSSGRSQGWHDKAGRSLVVDVRGITAAPSADAGVASLLPGAPAPTGHAGRYPAAPSQPGYAPAQPGYAPAAAQAGYAPYPPAGPVAPGPAAPPVPGAPASFAPPTPVPTSAPSVPDPWAFPSSPAPAGDGLITGVPGAGGAPAPAVAPAAPAPAAPAPAPAPAPVPATAPPAAEPAEPEWDSTRMTARDVRAMDPAPDVAVVLELESGERRAVDRPTLLGRNPQAPDDGPWILVAVDDPTRSVSKTHAELRVDPSGLWLTDRGSTNGTVVSVPGAPPRVAEAGARVRVPVGATIHVGDRRIVVHPGAS